jgi:hypothetical protein
MDVPPAPMPSNFEKNLPLYVKIAGVFVAGLGAWIQNTLAPDADFQALFPNAHNAIGVIVMVLGGIGTLCSTFVTNFTNKKYETAIEHKDVVIENKDVVIDHKDAVIAGKEIEVVAAAEAPPVPPDGVDPVWHSLCSCGAQATALGRTDITRKILDICDSIVTASKAGAA